MAFTTWAAVRADILDAIADYASSGKFMMRRYTKGNFSREIGSITEAKDFLKLTYEMESLESAGVTSACTSYGRPRRFR